MWLSQWRLVVGWSYPAILPGGTNVSFKTVSAGRLHQNGGLSVIGAIPKVLGAYEDKRVAILPSVNFVLTLAAIASRGSRLALCEQSRVTHRLADVYLVRRQPFRTILRRANSRITAE